MRRIFLMCLLCAGWTLLCAQNDYGIGEGFDPENPGDPDAPAVMYTMKAVASPGKGGSVSGDGSKVAAGTTVWMNAYDNTGYKFEKWTENGVTVSEERSFGYTMPARNVTLTAVFRFDPDNPGNPDTMAVSHTVTLVAAPARGGSFNTDKAEVSQGRYIDLYAYPQTNYEFKGWQIDGVDVSASSPYRLVPDRDVVVTGLFAFNPSNPSNPGKNSFNPETGELVIDDFEPGRIMSAVDEAVGGSGYRSKVQMVTVSGRMESYDFGIANNLPSCTYFDLSRTYGYSEVPSYAFDGTGVCG